MATKRPHPAVHPSHHDQVPSEPSRKKRKPNLKASQPGAKTFKKAHPVNELKSRIRSLKRQLERNDALSAVVQQEKERALRAAEDELERNERARKRSEIIGRWHKVRFFERRKAEKRVKRLRKEIEGLSGEERSGVEGRLEEAEVDVKYAVYFPLERDYVPLFPNRKKREGSEGDDGEEDEQGEVERQGDPAMWAMVKRCMADGTLDALRNGGLEKGRKDEASDDGRARKKRPKPTTRAKKRDGGAASEDESDEGGNAFWE